MSLVLYQNASACGMNVTVPFEGAGGTAPYVYSVAPMGAGGSINASTGIYTAPNLTGIDTIVVTDSLLNTAQNDIKILDPIGLFCDVLKTEMDLADDQVYLYNQKFDIPKDNRLYINVGILMEKPFGNNLTFDGASSGLQAIQSLNVATTLNIDIFSKGNDARTRVGELILALSSDYALSQQELNAFRIFPISTRFHNLAWIDGSAIPYRFNLNVTIHYFLSKIVGVEYYDNFSDPQITTDS